MSVPAPSAPSRLGALATRPELVEILAAFVLVTLADSLVTGVGMVGGMHEANPVDRMVVQTLGLMALPLVKLPVLGLGAIIGSTLSWSWARPLLRALTVVTGVVVAWNVILLITLTSH